MKKLFTLFAVPFLCAFLVSSSAWGQSTVTWSFGSSTSDSTSLPTSGTPVSNLTIGNLSQGNNNGTTTLLTTTSASSGYTGASGGMNAGAASRTGSLSTGASGSAYFQFTLTPIAGYIVTLTDISFGSRGTSTGPQAYTLRYSTDSYGSDLATGTLAANSTWALKSNTGLSIVSSAGTALTLRIYGYSGTGSPTASTANWRIDDLSITVTLTAAAAPTKLVVSSINGGSSPSVNTPFDIVIQAQDNSNTPQNVSANTDVSLSLATGTGSLSGTLTGTITAGSNSVTISGITYNTAESGVSITATVTSGDALTAGTSSTFTSLDAASQLAFVNVPAGGQPSTNLSSFTVEARRGDNSVDANYTGSVTIAKASGSGNISGTLTQAASSGVATFSNIQFDASGTYTISASSGSLTSATSGSINILSTTLPLVEDFQYTTGTTLTSNGWTAHSAAGTNAITVVGSGLTYSNYASSGVGNSVSLTTSGEDDSRVFTQQTSGDVYVAFMVNVSAATATGDYFFNLSTNPLGTFYARVFAKDDGSGNLLFGVAKNSVATYATGTYAYNTTHLIVVKYTFNASSADDVVGIYINPSLPGSEPGAFSAQATTSEVDAPGIGAIALRQGTAANAATLTIDGIRVATSWGGNALPVELTSFTATTVKNNVLLSWSTATETQNSGFEIERRAISNQLWTKVGFVEGAGISNSPKSYTFTDHNTNAGRYAYRLKQINTDGSYKIYQEAEVNVALSPAEYALSQNYPNPFNPSTTLSFAVHSPQHASLKVYNLLGQEVATLFNGMAEADVLYKVAFNAAALPSGVYFSVLKSDERTEMKRMMLMK